MYYSDYVQLVSVQVGGSLLSRSAIKVPCLPKYLVVLKLIDSQELTYPISHVPRTCEYTPSMHTSQVPKFPSTYLSYTPCMSQHPNFQSIPCPIHIPASVIQFQSSQVPTFHILHAYQSQPIPASISKVPKYHCLSQHPEFPSTIPHIHIPASKVPLKHTVPHAYPS